MSVFITSDYHYGHKNICRATSVWPDKEKSTRDFASIHEMNQAMIDNTNKVVSSQDSLIMVGDIVMNKKKYWESLEEFLSQINCKNLWLILGNHDRSNSESIDKYKKYFSVVDSLVYFENFLITHVPVNNTPSNCRANLHGHIHSRPAKITSTSMDIGIDGHPEFRPYHIDEIKEKFK